MLLYYLLYSYSTLEWQTHAQTIPTHWLELVTQAHPLRPTPLIKLLERFYDYTIILIYYPPLLLLYDPRSS